MFAESINFLPIFIRDSAHQGFEVGDFDQKVVIREFCFTNLRICESLEEGDNFLGVTILLAIPCYILF